MACQGLIGTLLVLAIHEWIMRWLCVKCTVLDTTVRLTFRFRTRVEYFIHPPAGAHVRSSPMIAYLYN